MFLSMKESLTPDEMSQLVALTVENYREFLNPKLLELKDSGVMQEAEWSADGAIMRDIEGNEFIDCLAGYGVFVLGHRPKRVVDAVLSIYSRMGLYSQELLSPLQGELARKLASITPGDLKFTYYHLGGGESNDAAIKIARSYHRVVNRDDRYIHVTFRTAFHGKTFGALSATNRPGLKYRFLPLVTGIGEPGTVAEYNNLDSLERVMSLVGYRAASVIVEPVQGEGGIIVPSSDFLPGVRALCDRYGALLHVDEVQSGFCRSGRMFCCEYTGVVPDIMTMAKAMSGGVFPISAMTVRPHVIKAAEENPWYFTNTYAGSAPGCAAALAAISMMEDENIAMQSAEKGLFFKEELQKIAIDFPKVIKEVRGLGMWIGVEFYDDKIATKVAQSLFRKRILVAHTINNPKVMRLQPPVVITDEQLAKVISAFRQSVAE